MRTAVFSDVHSNLEALQAGHDLGVGRWVCLGDVVGYAADPEACIALVSDMAAVILQGNHDATVAGVQSDEYFNSYAQRSVEWTRQRLTAENLANLRGLSLIHADVESFFVHAEPGQPQAWNYVCDATDAALALDVVSERLLYVGHSHLAFICAAAEEVYTVLETETDSVELVRVFYNVSATQQKILDAGLPRFLADRLNQGC